MADTVTVRYVDGGWLRPLPYQEERMTTIAPLIVGDAAYPEDARLARTGTAIYALLIHARHHGWPRTMREYGITAEEAAAVRQFYDAHRTRLDARQLLAEPAVEES